MTLNPTAVTFIGYMLLMLGLGFFAWHYTRNFNDYILGGRSLGGLVTALSVGASDMSGWLLMGLPGAVYLFGVSESWLAIGLIIGTFFNWKFVAARLRVYTEIEHNALTLPDFFTHRFKDTSRVLRIAAAAVILVFFTIYCASGVVAGARLFENTFGMDYSTAVWAGAAATILYVFIGGFLAVSWTDAIQATLMCIALVITPFVVVYDLGGFSATVAKVESINPNMLNMMTNQTFVGIASLLAWGLGYFGQPHILVRFMGISSPQAIKKSRRIATVWVLISLTAAIMIGVSGRMFLGDGLLLNDGNQETIYISMVAKIFPVFIAGIFLSAILAAIMSTADSQLLVTASAITEDFYHNKIRKNASEKELMWVSRGCVMAVAIIAVLIATNQNSTILGLVSYAWGGFGSAFGPLVLCSLFWRRTNKQGAYAGIIVGGVVDLVWAQLPGGIFDLYEIVPGFVFGLLAIVVVSLLTPAPTKAVTDEFESYHHCVE